jgi:predicted transcriptional regulator of viral defense system
MKFDELQKSVREMSFFDLAFLVQTFVDPRCNIRVQLTRWMREGRVLSLRRGMYTLAEPYRKKAVSLPALANVMCRPSYLSGLWALGFYGLIPEQVHVFTSVTARGPRRFENALGAFEYRHIKRAAFFGYERVGTGDESFLVATPAKALVDHWHLHAGEWTEARLDQMRYQNTDSIQTKELLKVVDRMQSPRLRQAAERWIRLQEMEKKGSVDL